MRLTLFSILTAILLVTATARRGAKDSPPPVASRKNIHVPQRRYPYGWGLGPEVGIEVLEDKEKETKEVKRVVNKRKRKDAPPVPEKKPGWFRSTEHHYVDEVEEILDGLE